MPLKHPIFSTSRLQASIRHHVKLYIIHFLVLSTLFWYSQGMSISFVLFSLKLSQQSQFLEVEANFSTVRKSSRSDFLASAICCIGVALFKTMYDIEEDLNTLWFHWFLIYTKAKTCKDRVLTNDSQWRKTPLIEVQILKCVLSSQATINYSKSEATITASASAGKGMW